MRLLPVSEDVWSDIVAGSLAQHSHLQVHCEQASLLLHNFFPKKIEKGLISHYIQIQDCINSVEAEFVSWAKTKSLLLQSRHYSSNQRYAATTHPLAPCFDHEQTTRYIVDEDQTSLRDGRSVIIYTEPLGSSISNLTTGSIWNIFVYHLWVKLQVSTPHTGNVPNIWMGIQGK
jgi:hypothetical protein